MATNKGWIGELVQVDVILVGSWAHQFQWMWTNLAPLEVMQQASELIHRSPTCLVDDILNLGRHSHLIWHDEWPPLVVVNRVSLPQVALPTLLSFPHSHAFKNGAPWLIWDSHSSSIEKPNANEKEHDTIPSSLVDSNVSLNWKQWKSQELGHTP
jgi:hypothetical protein